MPCILFSLLALPVYPIAPSDAGLFDADACIANGNLLRVDRAGDGVRLTVIASGG